MGNAKASKVVISNGFSKFNLDNSAEEAARSGRLALYLTGIYPTKAWRRILSGQSWEGSIGRFLGRAAQIPDGYIKSFVFPEVVHKFAGALPPSWKGPQTIGEYLDVHAFKLYSARAAHEIARRAPSAQVYHYRSGFGGASLVAARDRGMVLLCEHSIAHPKTVDYLVAKAGALPSVDFSPQLRRLWQHISDDIDPADFVVVNSGFVKNTMVAAGYNPDKVVVLYRGIDDEFLSLLASEVVPARREISNPLRLLFAGAFSKRKGATSLERAISMLGATEGWTLMLAGPVDNDSRAEYQKLSAHPRVRTLGQLSRIQLARAMREADVFLFPSLAEGSARVVFEALAAGCYVVTTKNAGSIVGEDAEGIVIEPANPRQLAGAIVELLREPQRVARGGEKNAALIKSSYQQSAYGANLIALYDSLAASGRPPQI